jgi:hypothetical protein
MVLPLKNTIFFGYVFGNGKINLPAEGKFGKGSTFGGFGRRLDFSNPPLYFVCTFQLTD